MIEPHRQDQSELGCLAVTSRAIEVAQGFAGTFETVWTPTLERHRGFTLREDLVVPPASMIIGPWFLPIDGSAVHDLYHLYLCEILDASIGRTSAPLDVTRAECAAAAQILELLEVPWIVEELKHIRRYYVGGTYYRRPDERLVSIAQALRYVPPPTRVGSATSSRAPYSPAPMFNYSSADPLVYITRRHERISELCSLLERESRPALQRHERMWRDPSSLIPTRHLRNAPYYRRWIEAVHVWGDVVTSAALEFRASAEFLLQYVLIPEDQPTPAFRPSLIDTAKDEVLHQVAVAMRIAGIASVQTYFIRSDVNLHAAATLCNAVTELFRRAAVF